MYLAVSDPNKHRDVSVQIDQRVHLHRAFLLTETSPGEHRQAQVDRRRVQCVRAVLELHAKRIVSVEAASALNEDLSEIGEDTPVMFFVRIRQCRTRDSATDAHVVQLVRRGPQTCLDVAQTLSVGELRKRQAQELVPARESAQPIIPVVASDTSSKFSIWKEGDQLGKYGAAEVHQPLLASLARALQQGQIQIAATQKPTQLPISQEVASTALNVSRTLLRGHTS